MSKKKIQKEIIGAMLMRKRGVTHDQVWEGFRIKSFHRRLTDLERDGWTISRIKVLDRNFKRYFGIPPKAKTVTCANK